MAVLCFCLGLAMTMVGIDMVVVSSFAEVTRTGRFSRLSTRAPFMSAMLVITSGLAALLLAP